MNIEARIKKVLATVMDENETSIDENTSQDTIANWDSIRHMELALALQDEFKIHLSNDDILEIMSYAAIKSVILSRLN